MNAPEPIAALLAERPAIAGAVQMPINLLAPSPTNPRRHRLDKEADERAWNLTELAASIEKHDVIQPILARPDMTPRQAAGRQAAAATDAFVAAHKGKAKDKADAPLPLKNGVTLSAEAAWPFPTEVAADAHQ